MPCLDFVDLRTFHEQAVRRPVHKCPEWAADYQKAAAIIDRICPNWRTNPIQNRKAGICALVIQRYFRGDWSASEIEDDYNQTRAGRCRLIEARRSGKLVAFESRPIPKLHRGYIAKLVLKLRRAARGERLDGKPRTTGKRGRKKIQTANSVEVRINRPMPAHIVKGINSLPPR